jgi:hypothetical protein
MTKESEEVEPEEFDDVEEEGENLRQLIRDEIESVLRKIPGESSVSQIKKQLPDEDEPLTLRALEASVRSIVEDAMIPLRESQQKAKPKPKAKAPEREPEPAPTKVTRSKLTSFLWGEE